MQNALGKTAIILSLMMLLSGCLVEEETEPQIEQQPEAGIVSTIGPADLSDETSRIINALGVGNIHVFDMQLNEDQPVTIRVWGEYFEDGVKKDPLFDFSSGARAGTEHHKGNSQILFQYNFAEDENEDERALRLLSAILFDQGSSSGASEVVLPTNAGGRVTSPMNSDREITMNQPVTLLTIIEDDGDFIGSGEGSVIRYDETGEEPADMLQYDRVILFRLMIEEGELR